MMKIRGRERRRRAKEGFRRREYRVELLAAGRSLEVGRHQAAVVRRGRVVAHVLGILLLRSDGVLLERKRRERRRKIKVGQHLLMGVVRRRGKERGLRGRDAI